MIVFSNNEHLLTGFIIRYLFPTLNMNGLRWDTIFTIVRGFAVPINRGIWIMWWRGG